MILQVLYYPNDSVILWLLVIWHLSELFKKVYQSQMHMLFILHVKSLVNCKRKSSVGMKCQEQCGLCRKSLSCILNSKDRKVLNRWWLTVYSLPAAPNGKGSLRYTKQNAQPEVLAAPDVWVFRLIICIAIHIKLVLSGEKKKRRQKWTHHTASEWHPCGSSAGPDYVQSPAETCCAELVAFTAVCHPLCQPCTHHTQLVPLFWLSSVSTNFKKGTAAHPVLLQ